MKSEMPPIFWLLQIYWIASLFALLACLVVIASLLFLVGFDCIAWVASLLLFVGFSWVVGCVVGGSFSLRMIATKERARRVGASSLRGLLLFVCYMFSAAFIASSFDFEKIQPAPQVRCALNLPPKLFKVSLIARVSPIIARAFSE